MKAVVADAGAGTTPFTLFTLWTYGKIEIGFQQLKTRPPFTDEQLRMQLLDRLNAVPGVELPIASLGALPPTSFDVLQPDESRRGFFSATDWVTMVLQQMD